MANEFCDQQVLHWLCQASAGDESARTQVFQCLQPQLLQIAEFHLRREAVHPTLQATCLINTVFMKQMSSSRRTWTDLCHFLALASKAMRRILVDQARHRRAQKRGGGVRPIDLAVCPEVAAKSLSPLEILETNEEAVAIRQELKQLRKESPELAEVLWLSYFDEYSLAEIADVLEVSVGTVKRRKARAKRSMYQRLKQNSAIKLD